MRSADLGSAEASVEALLHSFRTNRTVSLAAARTDGRPPHHIVGAASISAIRTVCNRTVPVAVAFEVGVEAVR